MTILITGGAGYIGSHMVKLLRDQKIDCIVIDDFSTGYKEALLGATYINGDIGDSKLLDEVFTKTDITSVIHFASRISVSESVQSPSEYYTNNVAKTLVLLRKMVEYGVNQLVFSSTAAIFGSPSGNTISETTSINPINPYGRTKAFVEQILEDFDKSYGLKSVCLRYFNAAGADPSGLIGESHHPETHLIPLVLQVAAGRRESIIVNGIDYPTKDGTCVRDYVHVVDLCQAHLLALSHLSLGGESRQYNIGSGDGYSVYEIIEAAKKVTGMAINVSLGERRTGDPPTLVANSDKIKTELGWNPSRTSIDTIVEDAWRWEQKWPWY
jgi:UDP-glucose 4-epimerase